MRTCPQCFEENPGRARFCLACGAPLEPVPAESRRLVTILFCDLTGSTTLGDRRDPEQLRLVLSRYADEARTVIERHGGTVEKFIGDAVMAVFGIPVVHEDDALRAARAALELRTRLARLNTELERDVGITIQTRTGINSGEVIAGDAARGQGFVTGDAVNVAKRLEENAGTGEILIGYATYRLARDAVEVDLLPPIAVKGKADPVTAYRLAAVSAEALPRPRRLDVPMVGRLREREILRSAFAQIVVDRTCHLVTILGPAGIGKSRLVSEVLREIEGEAEILSGRCLPYGEGITLWPVIEVVKQATGITDADTAPEARAKIAAALDGDDAAELIADRLADAIGFGTDPASAQDIFWALRRLFEARARRRPLVVVLDDVNWGEPTFFDLVEHLPDWAREAPILILCMARPELLDVRPGWAVSKENATTLRLEPLADAETRTLAENLAGAVDDVVLRRVIEAAEGNPFFVEEMLAALLEDGMSSTSVPTTIQVLLAARLDRLEAGERQALECAAVEGKEFHGGAVATLAGPVVRDSLFGLVRKDLVRPHRATIAGEDGFAFRHILLRDAAYEALPKARRAELHEHYAEWLERAARERAVEYEELLGYHLEQAFRYRSELSRTDAAARSLAGRAADRLGAAGNRALARGDARAAAGLLDRASSLLTRGDSGRPELLVVLGRALCESGELDRAEVVLDDAVQEAGDGGGGRLQARARIWKLSLDIQRGAGFEECLLQTNEAIALLEDSNDDLGLAQAFQFAGRLEFWLGRSAASVGSLERSLDYARRAEDRREEIEALGWLLISLFFGATPAREGIRRCDQIRRSAAGNTQLEAYALISRGGLDAMQNRIDDARETVARGREMLHDLGAPLLWAAAASVAGSVELIAGDEHAAEDVMLPAYELLEEMGEAGYLSTVAAYLAEAAYRRGRDDESLRLTRVSERAAAADDFESQACWRAVRAKLQARQGQVEEAEALARQAVEIAKKTDFLDLRGRTLLSLAEVLRLSGQHADAKRVSAEAIDEFERKQNLVMAQAAREGVPS